MAVVGWILLSLLILLLLIVLLPFGVKTEYLSSWKVTLLLFGVIPIYTFLPKPSEEKDVQPETETVSTAPPETEKASLFENVRTLYREEGVSGVVRFFKQLLELFTGALCRFAKCISVRKLALCIRVGGEEADGIAADYGKICAVLFPSLSALSHGIRIRRPSVLVVPDFTVSDTTVRLRAVFWLFPLGVIVELVGLLIKCMVVWFRTMKTTSDVSRDQQAST